MSIEDMDAGQNALLAEVMALSPEVRRVKLLSAAKAALMLDMSVSTLEKRRKKLKPPPPAPNWAGGKKGNEVKYLASTLVEYIAGEPISQPNPYPHLEHLPIAKNAAASRKNALSNTGPMRHVMRFGVVSAVSNDDATWPFFVDRQGLVIAPCWESIQSTVEMFMNERIEVNWMDWINALASVWVDEAVRHQWLMAAEEESPGLCQRVDESRRAKLRAL